MSNKKPKLIFLWNYVEWGGAQIFLLAIMKEARADFDIIVILPRDSMPTILRFLDELDIRYEFFDVAIQVGPAPGLGEKLKRQWKRLYAEFTSFRYLRRFDLKSSILHIETAPWQSWLLLTALAVRRANIFVTMHNFMPRASKLREFIWRSRLQFVSRLPGFHIFPTNQDTKDKLEGWVAGDFWEKMTVAYTAVNPAEIEAAIGASSDVSAIRHRHGLEADKFVVLCVGQFIDRKGRWIYLEAARAVLEHDKDVRFVWLTPKLPDAGETASINGYCLGDSFRIILSDTLGTGREDVLKFFRIADVFVLPSFVEGLPIALLEAMALGIPCISTRVYAIPEAVRNMETGLLIEAGDHAALADAIIKLKNDVELRIKLGMNGREFVIAHFDERVVARAVIGCYKRSLQIK